MRDYAIANTRIRQEGRLRTQLAGLREARAADKALLERQMREFEDRVTRQILQCGGRGWPVAGRTTSAGEWRWTVQ